MKIAICLSGEPREFEKTWFSWSKLRNHPELDIDFFIHTWEDKTMPGDNSGRRNKKYYDTISKKINKENISDEESGYVRWVDNYNKYKSDNPEIDLEQYDQKFNIDELRMKLNKYYNPIKLVISEKTELIKYFYENEIWVVPSKFDAYMDSNYGSVSQWYSTQSSFKLKEDYYKGTLSHKEKAKRKYDLSIKSRFDTFCMIQTEDDINRFVRQMQYLLVSEDVGVYTSWIEIMDGDIRTEFATMIGKDQLMHKMWDNILPEISRWYHLAAENHHDIFTKYVAHQLKYTKMRLVSRNILQKFIIVRPTIKIDKLKRIYKDQNYNKLADYIIKHYQQFNSIWNGAPFK